MRFFPDEKVWQPPEHPYSEEDRKTVAVLGGLVSRIRFSLHWAVFSVIVPENNKLLGFRFRIPKHKKIVKDFLREGGIRYMPSKGSFDVSNGMFLVQFQGTITGEDRVPDEISPEMPQALYVVDVADVSRAILMPST